MKGPIRYAPLSDPHLKAFYATKPEVRKHLQELGFVRSDLRVVLDVEHQMRVVDRALAELASEDSAVARDRTVAQRGAAMAALAERQERERAAKHTVALQQYAKEKKRRMEQFESKMSRSQ